MRGVVSPDAARVMCLQLPAHHRTSKSAVVNGGTKRYLSLKGPPNRPSWGPPTECTKPSQRRHRVITFVDPNPFLDTPPWTLDQIAGLVFGGVMVASYFGAGVVDDYVARGQREELGICQQCSGLNDASTCTEERCPKKTPEGAAPT